MSYNVEYIDHREDGKMEKIRQDLDPLDPCPGRYTLEAIIGHPRYDGPKTHVFGLTLAPRFIQGMSVPPIDEFPSHTSAGLTRRQVENKEGSTLLTSKLGCRLGRLNMDVSSPG